MFRFRNAAKGSRAGVGELPIAKVEVRHQAKHHAEQLCYDNPQCACMHFESAAAEVHDVMWHHTQPMLLGLLGAGHRSEVLYFVAMLKCRGDPGRNVTVGNLTSAVMDGRMILRQVRQTNHT
jgi:hypothetical protein